MNDPKQWQEENARYLTAALAWLRLRLERQAQRESGPVRETTAGPMSAPPATPVEPAQPSIFARFLGHDAPPVPARPVLLLPPASGEISDEQIARAAAEMDAAATIDPPPALHIMATRLGMSRFERDVLLLCTAMELGTGTASLCGLAQGAPNRPFPTFALAMTLFEDPAWEALSPERPLRYWRLIEINQPGAQPLTTSALRADERVVNYLKGLNYLEDRLAPLLVPVTPPGGGIPLPASQQSAVDTIIRGLEPATEPKRLPVIQMPGSDSGSKQLIAWHVANALGLHLYRLPAEWLPGNAAELETLARFLNRESILLPVAFLLDASETDRSGGETSEGNRSNTLLRFLSRVRCLFFLDTRDVRQLPAHESLTLDVAKPTRAEQQSAWQQALGDAAADSPALLAGQFNLGLAEIRRLTEAAGESSTHGARTAHERLWDGCLDSTRPRLDELAQRLDVKASWADLVVPGQESKLLHQIAAQVSQRSKVYEDWGFSQKMNRGLGISALFAGESGTGKSMAAEVIANELRLNLYRIDLSAVVSKYIGETEKNLRRLFDAAEDGGAILFFDEADALFGKRSEVRDSHDRYANIEINYLLQRLEAYRGLAILATNMKSALDGAFTRRLRFIVNFPFPGLAERREIWRSVFPVQTLTNGLDFDRLARLNLTGGNIHNVALNAAFLAAKANQAVTMPRLFEAARAEFGKLERPVSEGDLYWPELDERASGAAA